VQTRELAKSFGTRWGPRVRALENVSLTVAPGEVLGILGPNGSGKTTLLDVLLGFQKPDAGSVSVLGLPPGHPDALARIGHLPQGPVPYPRLTGRRFLVFVAEVQGVIAPARRAGELISRLGLDEVANRPMSGYSTGTARRIGLAQALVHRPELLLLDEPTANLDPVGSALVRQMLAEEARRGATILLASHHLHEVEKLATRIVVLGHGKIAAEGSVESLLAAPDQRMLIARGVGSEHWSRLLAEVRAVGEVVHEGPAMLDLEEAYRRFFPKDGRS
jgi:ABC-2 type transport system ATP-binding protein